MFSLRVGTDPNLTLKTRRGTGYGKIPSLQDIWYRGMFGHQGWCAVLQDWLNPHREDGDYVPAGFKPCGARTVGVKEHPIGLGLSAEDRTAWVALLRTF